MRYAALLETLEPEQLGEKRMTVKQDAQPMLLMGYKIEGLNHPDWPVYQAIADILGQGRTSRLYTEAVKKQKKAEEKRERKLAKKQAEENGEVVEKGPPIAEVKGRVRQTILGGMDHGQRIAGANRPARRQDGVEADLEGEAVIADIHVVVVVEPVLRNGLLGAEQRRGRKRIVE